MRIPEADNVHKNCKKRRETRGPVGRRGAGSAEGWNEGFDLEFPRFEFTSRGLGYTFIQGGRDFENFVTASLRAKTLSWLWGCIQGAVCEGEARAIQLVRPHLQTTPRLSSWLWRIDVLSHVGCDRNYCCDACWSLLSRGATRVQAINHPRFRLTV